MDNLPKAEDFVVPVFIPQGDGNVAGELGTATLAEGKLTIEFKETFPGVAVQRMLARGELLGLTFVQVMPAEEETQEEKDARDLAILQTEDTTPDDLL